MKKLFLLILSVIVLNAGDKIKFENKIVEEIAIQDSARSFINFKVLCINGYKYLYVDSSKTTTQMFQKPKGNIVLQPVACTGDEN